MANLAVFTAYPSFVGRHWTGLPRGCLIQRTYKRKNKTEPSNSTFLRPGSREAYAIESRTGSRYSSTSSRFYQLYTASLIHGERQTNKTQRAPVRDACMELDNPASVREPLDLLPTMDPGGENIWAKKNCQHTKQTRSLIKCRQQRSLIATSSEVANASVSEIFQLILTALKSSRSLSSLSPVCGFIRQSVPV